MALQGIYDAKHWRDRAAEIRALSDEMKDVKVRSLILRLANDYDKLADRAEDLFHLLDRFRQIGEEIAGVAQHQVVFGRAERLAAADCGVE